MAIKELIVGAASNPKFLLAAGIGGFVIAGIWACAQTLKVENICDEQNAKLDEIIESHSEEELQTPEVKKETNIIKAKTVGRLVLNYAGPVVVAGVATYLLCRSYGLQRQAYLAVSAAYGGLAKAYDSVLNRVEKKWGQEGLKYAKYGIEETKVEREITDEKGKIKKIEDKEDRATERWSEMKEGSPNLIIFDEETPLYKQFGGSAIHIKSELQTTQAYLQTQYHAGVPIFYNTDIVRNTCGNDARWMTDAGQITGCYKWDPANREAINDTVDLRIGTFVGTDAETGNPKTYVYIDPIVSLVNLDANKKIYPQADIINKKRFGKKYISQVSSEAAY